MPMIWKNKGGAGRVAATITITVLMRKREKATVVRIAKENSYKVWRLGT